MSPVLYQLSYRDIHRERKNCTNCLPTVAPQSGGGSYHDKKQGNYESEIRNYEEDCPPTSSAIIPPFPLPPMSILREFRDFAMKGNVVDMAVGVIIGTAFGKIVSSLVGDVIMPGVGILLGKVDFKTLAFEIGSTKIAYGMFIQSVVDFVIVAFCIFIIVKQMNCFKKPVPAAVPAEPPA